MTREQVVYPSTHVHNTQDRLGSAMRLSTARLNSQAREPESTRRQPDAERKQRWSSSAAPSGAPYDPGGIVGSTLRPSAREFDQGSLDAKHRGFEPAKDVKPT